MNITAWEIALNDSGLLPEYQDVIDGFQHGFDQEIPDHVIHDETSGDALPYFTPSNHSSAILAKGKISASIAEEVAAERMFGR